MISIIVLLTNKPLCSHVFDKDAQDDKDGSEVLGRRRRCCRRP
jgi:hypothetical protein